MNKPDWQQFEHDVAERLGLDLTIASGSQFQDPGDAVDNANPNDVSFRLLADCKYTEKGSYTLQSHYLAQWAHRAVEAGKRFVLPVRFNGVVRGDYVLLTLDDFAELLAVVRARYANYDVFRRYF